MKQSKKVLSFLVIFFLAWCLQAFARQEKGQHQQEPPPEAFTVCEGKQVGDKAELTGRQGETVTGTCESGKDGRLFLKPDHPPRQARQKN